MSAKAFSVTVALAKDTASEEVQTIADDLKKAEAIPQLVKYKKLTINTHTSEPIFIPQPEEIK